MTHDPYASPGVPPDLLERPAPLRDLRWRGVAWFAALPAALIIGFVLVGIVIAAGVRAGAMRVPFEMMVSVALPAGLAGYACGRRCRSTAWARYVALAARDALAWAVCATLLIWLLHGAHQRPAMNMLLVVGRAATITIPLTLLFAATMRWYYRDRP